MPPTEIRKRGLLIFFLIIVSTACNLPLKGAVSASPTPPQATTPPNQNTGTIPTPRTAAPPTDTPTSAPPSEHRIGVRLVDGVGEFYDRITSERFVPRGNNYIRLAPQRREDGSTQVYHSVFDPRGYNPEAISSAFQEMHDLGYNSVRVFVSQNTIGASGGLDPVYMDNVIDFLRLAQENELHVIITQDWLPGGKYGRILNRDCCDTFTMMNVHFLTQAGLEANQAYFQDFASYLIEHDAPMEALFSYELRNELYFDMDFPPLSFTSGKITALNGETYDMSRLEDKQRMVAENMVLWIDQVRESILKVDPSALVSVGFFWPQAPNPARIGDERYIDTKPAIWDSQADFIDLHPYPAAELTLEQYVENFGIDGMRAKPLLMGEFGVATQNASSVDRAASILMDWQVESCKYGFDGWLLWTWDLYENNDFYSAKSDQGQIGEVLAPVNRPDPCRAAEFDFLETNVALGKRVTASRALKEQPATNAVDGTDAQWGSGAFSPQWIQIDLGRPYSIEEIRLMVSQYPPGNTVHQVYVGGESGSLRLAHTFEGYTKDNQILVFTPDKPLENVQFIRIVTTDSPSWVSWKEVEVIPLPAP